jgi:hypothetical protein
VVNATSLQWQGALGKSKYNQLRGSLAKLGVNKLRDIVARSADGKQSAFDVSQSVGGVSTKAAEQMALAQLVEMGDTSEVVKKAIDRQKEGQGEAGNTGETAGEVIKEIMKGIQEKGVPLVQGLTDALTKLVANLGHLPQAVVAAAETAASAKAAGK